MPQLLRRPPAPGARSNETVRFTRIVDAAPAETVLLPDETKQNEYDARVDEAHAQMRSDPSTADGTLRRPPEGLDELAQLVPGQLAFVLGAGLRETGPPSSASAALASGLAGGDSLAERLISRAASFGWARRRAERRLHGGRIDLAARVGAGGPVAARLRELLGADADAGLPDAGLAGASLADASLMDAPDALVCVSRAGSAGAAAPPGPRFGVDVTSPSGFLEGAGERALGAELADAMVETLAPPSAGAAGAAGAAAGAAAVAAVAAVATTTSVPRRRALGDDFAFELLELRLQEIGLFEWTPDGVVLKADAPDAREALGALPLRAARADAGGGVGAMPRPRSLTLAVQGRALLATFALDRSVLPARPNDLLFVVWVARVLVLKSGEREADATAADAAYVAGPGPGPGPDPDPLADFADAVADAVDNGGKVLLLAPRMKLVTRAELQAGAAARRLVSPRVGGRSRELVVGGWQIGTVLDPAATPAAPAFARAVPNVQAHVEGAKPRFAQEIDVRVAWWSAARLARLAR